MVEAHNTSVRQSMQKAKTEMRWGGGGASVMPIYRSFHWHFNFYCHASAACS